MIKKVKNTFLWRYFTIDLGPKKVIKRKGDKLYVKWKSYYSSFNGCTVKKDAVI